MSGYNKRVPWALLGAVPQRVWQALLRVPCYLPYYHVVSDEPVPHVSHLYRFRTVREFRLDLDFLGRHFHPVSLAAVLDHMRGVKPLPSRALLLTFDDGFREMHDVVAPILQAKGFPAVFFLTTGFLDNADLGLNNKLSLLQEHLNAPGREREREAVHAFLRSEGMLGESWTTALRAIDYARRRLADRAACVCGLDIADYLARQRPYLTAEQVRGLLARGFEIGSHSVNHPLYARLPLDEQVRQTTESMQALSDQFGLHYRAFAFPFSDRGVGPDYFEATLSKGVVDVSFGTAGLVPHFAERHWERFSMEKTPWPPERILARWQARGLWARCRAGTGPIGSGGLGRPPGGYGKNTLPPDEHES